LDRAALRARLRIMGDLTEDAPDAAPDGTPIYDAGTVAAVKRFQARHILDADGVIGAATIEAVNVPLARRVRQIELAMERGRWLPALAERPTVFVNVGDGVRRVPAVLEPSPRHHQRGDRPPRPPRSGIPGPREPGDRGQWPRRRSGPAGHAREPGRSGCRSALRPAEAGTSELPGPRQVHLSQRRQHLHARNARAAALLADA